MKLVRCEKNAFHFYDSDKYPTCPHCGNSGEEVQQEVSGSVSSVTVLEPKTPRNEETAETGTSRWINNGDNVTGTSRMIPSSRYGTSVRIHDEDSDEDDHGHGNVPEDTGAGDVEAETGTSWQNTLAAAVQQARGTAVAEDAKTVAYYGFDEVAPVVGWLVCVRGAYKGEGFFLKTGRNMVGRSGKMDVVLAKEISVSRDKHTYIIYEPKKRKFIAQPGESSGLTYVNDELLLMPMEIHDYDLIQIGDAEFVFRSLCGEQFAWDDYT